VVRDDPRDVAPQEQFPHVASLGLRERRFAAVGLIDELARRATDVIAPVEGVVAIHVDSVRVGVLLGNRDRGAGE
jgi:hypothetical protein